jgi:hypothetical protein
VLVHVQHLGNDDRTSAFDIQQTEVRPIRSLKEQIQRKLTRPSTLCDYPCPEGENFRCRPPSDGAA